MLLQGHICVKQLVKYTIIETYHQNRRINFAQNEFVSYDAKLDANFSQEDVPIYIKGNLLF